MNLLKTPHEKLLEEAGMTPASPGMLNTPKQLLMQESGVTPSLFSNGGQPQQQMSPQDMFAAMVAAGHQPQKFATGGGVLGTNYVPEYNPEATFAPQPDRNTYTTRARDKFAEMLAKLTKNEQWSEKTTNDLFGTGQMDPWIGSNIVPNAVKLGVQFMNPITTATNIMDAPEQAFKEAQEGSPISGGITLGLAGLGALPYIGPATSKIKKLFHAIPKK